MWPPLLLVALLPAVSPFLLYGCIYSPVELCEGDESCYPDGLFGQCYSPTTGAPEPTKVGQLDDEQLELLTLELTRLAKNDQDWGDSRTQCVLAYYKLSMAYNLQYDPEFCNVRYPTNIWALIQLIDIGLNENAQLEGGDDAVAQYAEPAVETAEVLQVVPLVSNDDDSAEEDISELLQQISEPPPEIEVDDVLPESSVDPLVENYIQDIVARETPDLSQLSDEQLNDLLTRLFLLKKNLDEMAPVAQIVDQDGEAEEAIPLDEAAMADEQSILKKDAEHVGNVQLGLDNTEHKIVKGRNALSRVVGNRVYLKVNKVKDEKQLAPLVEYLENTIALPNNLIFDDFQFDNGQLSMRISRFLGQKPKTSKRIDSVEGVAQAVYKRRKDIARFSGAEVAETGIGSGEDTVPVESTDRDWLFRPVLVICGFTIMALLTVLGAHFYRSRKHYNTSIAQMAEGIEGGKNSHAYQELCRQRVGETSPRSKSSSTSSWCGDETQAPAIDISTGHVVLTFLQEFLSDPSKIEAQWNSLKEYRNHQKHTGMASQFVEKNRECLPFDENLVEVDTWKPEEKAYINASFLYDDDPRQAVYIAAQSPQGEEIAAWWQAVWQHGVCLIVNLSTLDETKAEKSYWPETGSQVHGPFEIHLVSEHIWSDDYLVRSFYLKNLQNGETRTITQFHYLSWKKDSTPPSAKSLLEFRRKVNKSYRGRSSPVLVHSWDGVGRVGVYCTLDLLCARLLRGVRQIDVAASVEHLRDQRDGMVRNGDQFKLIYGCLAQEVSALLKSAAS